MYNLAREGAHSYGKETNRMEMEAQQPFVNNKLFENGIHRRPKWSTIGDCALSPSASFAETQRKSFSNLTMSSEEQRNWKKHNDDEFMIFRCG